MTKTMTVQLTVVGPDEGPFASLDELREAIESACADIGSFDVDATNSEDGTEIWTIDEATVIAITD